MYMEADTLGGDSGESGFENFSFFYMNRHMHRSPKTNEGSRIIHTIEYVAHQHVLSQAIFLLASDHPTAPAFTNAPNIMYNIQKV